jgi:hypothetical protein
MHAFQRHPKIQAVFGQVVHFFSPDLSEEKRETIKCPENAMPGLVPGTMLIKTDIFKKIGWFDTRLKIGEFIDWYMKAVDCGLRMKVLNPVLLKRRIHRDNAGIRLKDSRPDYLKMLKKNLDRRRTAQHNPPSVPKDVVS